MARAARYTSGWHPIDHHDGLVHQHNDDLVHDYDDLASDYNHKLTANHSDAVPLRR